MLSQARIYFPTSTPLFDAAPYPDRLERWAYENSQLGTMEASIASKIKANINYISFGKFLEQLKTMIADFNAKCSEPYVLWIAQDTLGKLEEGCSERWVAGLAFEYGGLRMPEAIVTTPYLASYLETHPQIKSVLILDDALYSGTHFTRELSNVLTALANSKLYIGIPFMTNKINELIQIPEKHYQINMQLLDYIHLPRINELLTEEEITHAKTAFSFLTTNQTITYFDHKFPDEFSTTSILRAGNYLKDTTDCLKILEHIKPGNKVPEPGKTLIQDPDEWANRYFAFQKSRYIPLLPSIITPYKLHTVEEQNKLRKALEQGTTGSRNSALLPEHARYDEARALLGEQKNVVEPLVNSNTNIIAPVQEIELEQQSVDIPIQQLNNLPEPEPIQQSADKEVHQQEDLDPYFDDLLHAIQQEKWRLGYCLGFFTGLGGRFVTINEERVKVPEHAAQIVQVIQQYKNESLNPEKTYQKIQDIIQHAINTPKYSRAEETMQFYYREASTDTKPCATLA